MGQAASGYGLCEIDGVFFRVTYCNHASKIGKNIPIRIEIEKVIGIFRHARTYVLNACIFQFSDT